MKEQDFCENLIGQATFNNVVCVCGDDLARLLNISEAFLNGICYAITEMDTDSAKEINPVNVDDDTEIYFLTEKGVKKFFEVYDKYGVESDILDVCLQHFRSVGKQETTNYDKIPFEIINGIGYISSETLMERYNLDAHNFFMRITEINETFFDQSDKLARKQILFKDDKVYLSSRALEHFFENFEPEPMPIEMLYRLQQFENANGTGTDTGTGTETEPEDDEEDSFDFARWGDLATITAYDFADYTNIEPSFVLGVCAAIVEEERRTGVEKTIDGIKEQDELNFYLTEQGLRKFWRVWDEPKDESAYNDKIVSGMRKFEARIDTERSENL